MLQKRIIGVIAVENNWAVQSFGYKERLPLGRVEHLVENLDRWAVDEIIVLDFSRSRQGLGPNFELIWSISELGITTPLSYGGGVTSVENAVAVVQAGVERICVDSLLRDNPETIIPIAHQLGAQAIVAAMPIGVINHELRWYDYRKRTMSTIDSAVQNLFANGFISEALIIDWEHEGQFKGFNPKLIEAFSNQISDTPMLLYGGISDSEQLHDFLGHPLVSGVCVGNFLNYKEHALQKLKAELIGLPVRSASYSKEFI